MRYKQLLKALYYNAKCWDIFDSIDYGLDCAINCHHGIQKTRQAGFLKVLQIPGGDNKTFGCLCQWIPSSVITFTEKLPGIWKAKTQNEIGLDRLLWQQNGNSKMTLLIEFESCNCQKKSFIVVKPVKHTTVSTVDGLAK